MTDNLLFFHSPVSLRGEKSLCRDGGMYRYAARNGMFQFLTDGGGDALSLVILVYIQSVQISCLVYVAKANVSGI